MKGRNGTCEGEKDSENQRGVEKIHNQRLKNTKTTTLLKIPEKIYKYV